ncbi:MAG TPA: extracellular solute-binding protein [Dermatophilaceae bacterium]
MKVTRKRSGVRVWLASLGVLTLVACGSPAIKAAEQSPSPAGVPQSLTLYTSVTQDTIDAVVGGYEKAHPGSKVTVFRAPTGQLNARIAADQRSGGLHADAIWGTDPLSMQSYTDQHLLAPWPLPQLTSVPEQYRTPEFWGTRLLYLVIVARKDLRPQPTTWADLTSPAYRDKVALPDPAFAGSAFAALAYFSQAPGMGMDFYRALRLNGAKQVASVPDVVTEVAQGRYQLGITLDSGARTAVKKGSPIVIVWPKPGAIVLYSPIAMTARSTHSVAAKEFMAYVLSAQGQQQISNTGWQPIISGVSGPPQPAGATPVSPDWAALFGHQQELLAKYRSTFVQ